VSLSAPKGRPDYLAAVSGALGEFCSTLGSMEQSVIFLPI
jgi:hypothetical protein